MSSFFLISLFLDNKNDRKHEVSSTFADKNSTASCKSLKVAERNSSASSQSSDDKEISARELRNCIFVDAADKHDKLPIDAIDVDAMKMKGTYVFNQQLTSQKKFVDFMESNSVFGTSLSKNFYFYSVARQYAVKLKPISFHTKNFPN